MSEENVELAYRSLDAFNRCDTDAWAAFLSPDVAWESLRDAPGIREVYRGRAEAREWMEEVLEAAESGLHVEFQEIRDLGDDRVFSRIVTTGRGRGSGVPFEFHTWQVVWFAEGLITRRQVFRTRDEALEAAGLSE
jgi:ketosteroid isomerase-like protein